MALTEAEELELLELEEQEFLASQAPQVNVASVDSSVPDSSAEPSSGPGMVEAALLGGAKGASFGFDDNIAAAGGALLNNGTPSGSFVGTLATALSSPSKLKDSYNKFLDSYRSRQKEAEETQPEAFLVGELTGGLIGPSPIGKAASVGKLGKTGMSMLRGATDAALTAAGTADGGDLHTLQAAGTGAAVGFGLGSLGKLVNRVKNSDMASNARKIFNYASGGTDLIENLPKARRMAQEAADEMMSPLSKQANDAFAAKNKIFENATKEGKTIDLTDAVSFKDEIKTLSPDDLKAFKNVMSGTGKEVTPVQLETLRSDMSDLSSDMNASSKLKRLAGKFNDYIKTKQEAIDPTIKQKNEIIQKSRQLEELATGKSGKLEPKEAEAAQAKLTDTLMKGARPEPSTGRLPEKLRQIIEGTDYKGVKSPGLNEMIPGEMSPALEKAKLASEQGYLGELLANDNIGFRTNPTQGKLGSLVGSAGALGLRAVNFAGKTTHKVKNLGSNIAKAAGQPIEVLRDSVGLGNVSPEVKERALQMLSRATDINKQRALQYKIMSDPDLRQAFGVDVTEEGNE